MHRAVASVVTVEKDTVATTSEDGVGVVVAIFPSELLVGIPVCVF